MSKSELARKLDETNPLQTAPEVLSPAKRWLPAQVGHIVKDVSHESKANEESLIICVSPCPSNCPSLTAGDDDGKNSKK